MIRLYSCAIYSTILIGQIEWFFNNWICSFFQQTNSVVEKMYKCGVLKTVLADRLMACNLSSVTPESHNKIYSIVF
jgi:hypothetical protein